MVQIYPSRPRGMTLVEVLVALVILAFGLGGLVEMSLQLQKRQEANRRTLQSAYLAQDYLACIMAAGYSPLDEVINRSADPAKGAPLRTGIASNSMLNSNFTWNAHLDRETDAAGQKRIAITIIVADNRPNSASKERKAVGYVYAP